MGLICFQRTEDIKNHQKKMKALIRLWEGKETQGVIDGKKRKIDKVLIKAYGDGDPLEETMFKDLIMETTGNPVDPEFTMKPGDYRRIANAIENESKKLKSGKTSFLERHWFVKRGVLHKTAVSRVFNKGVDSIENYERNKFTQYVSANTKISKFIRAELVDRSLQSKVRPGIPSLKRLERLEKKAIVALANGDAKGIEEANGYLRDISDFLSSDEGKVIQEYIDYMENPDSTTSPRTGENWSHNIARAGDESRILLNKMGSSYVSGLKRFGSVLAMDALHTNPIKYSSKQKRFDTSDPLFSTGRGKSIGNKLSQLAEAITAIEDGIKNKNYFPHFVLRNFAQLDKLRDSIQEGKDVEGDLKKMEPLLSDIIKGFTTPKSVRPATEREHAEAVWMKNPLAAIRRYSLDGIAFNRNNHLKELYLNTVRHLPDERTWSDPEVLNGMRRYIDDTFMTAYITYKNRPDWINKATRAITGMEFLSKMGFGFTTAVRNSMSGLFFVSSMGAVQYGKYMKEWNSNSELANKVRAIEENQGFKFKELSSPAFTEGLLPTRGMHESDLKFITDSGGENPRFEYRDEGVWKVMDSAFSKVAGKAAVFQRTTENFIRREMFRATFVQMYNHLKSRPSGELSEKQMDKIATDVSLQSVNKYAFEYAAYAKPPVLGGTHKKYGAVGQVVGQFFHFPFSFLQLQSKMLRNAKDAAVARQWDSDHLSIPIRFFGLWALTQTMSGVLNLDLTNIIEHDTLERIKDFRNKIILGEEGLARGYVGPAVGDLVFLSSLSGLLELPDNKILDLVIGANDAYKMTDEEKSHRLLSTLNVQLSKMVHRDWPALKGGNGWNMLMHEFVLYPRSWTREMRKWRGFSWAFEDKSKGFLTPYGTPKRGGSGKRKKKSSVGGPVIRIPALSSAPKSSAKPMAGHIPKRQKPYKYNEFDKGNLFAALDNIEETAAKESKIYTKDNTRTHHISTT